MVSTSTIRGLSRIEREFEASDQRPYFVPCPHCGTIERLPFYRLRWVKVQPKTAAYHSTDCERPISNGPAAVAAARLPSTAAAEGML